ncbi:hypothetical protein [Ollibium composti]|uniref:hypothetical protein n=1 Tax=Ollibium composti TaxID=2675109 RepID=UPI00198096D6|nr:hypothetical protein [Mesorhizobium composti]
MSAGLAGGATPVRRNWRLIAISIAAAVMAVFVAANAHFIYVAFTSQPDCVPHAKAAGTASGALRAADSAC